MLEVRGLSFSYGGVKALDSIEHLFREGRITGIFGPNGSGKSTLLKCLCGVLNKYEGEIYLNGAELASLPPRGLAKSVSFVPQNFEIAVPFKVKEVVLMGRAPHQQSLFAFSEKDLVNTATTLRVLELISISDRMANELSGGQKQMVNLARAINQDSQYLMLDEPTSNLDIGNTQRIWRTLHSLRDNGKSIVLASHDINQLAWNCDEVLILKDGAITVKGIPNDVLNAEMLDSLFKMKVEEVLHKGRKTFVPFEPSVQ